MTRFEREQLIGYLLGTLDRAERSHLRGRLDAEPELREQLARVAEQIKPLEQWRVAHKPPPGLADRTMRFVFGGEQSTVTAPPALSPAVEGGGSWASRMSWADWTVAAALLLAASTLVFPALQRTRFQARLQGCQENLRQIGVAMMQYSERQGGYLPVVPRAGRRASAGIYAPVLFSQGLLDRAGQVVCPDSPLAERSDFRVPELEELDAATPVEFASFQGDMGGSYGYSLGHWEDGVYRPTRDLRRPHFAIVADRPSPGSQGLSTLHHGARGQNVLFEDGRVEFRTSPASPESHDRIFVNDHGDVGPGLHRDDSVIVSSTAAPILPGEPTAP